MYIQISFKLYKSLLAYEHHPDEAHKPHLFKVIDEKSKYGSKYTVSSVAFMNKFISDVNNQLHLGINHIKKVSDLSYDPSLNTFIGRVMATDKISSSEVCEFVIVNADKSGDTFLSQQFSSVLKDHLEMNKNWIFQRNSRDFFYQTYDLNQNNYASSIELNLRCAKTLGFHIVDMMPNSHIIKPFTSTKSLIALYKKNQSSMNNNRIVFAPHHIFMNVDAKSNAQAYMNEFLLFLVTYYYMENSTRISFNITEDEYDHLSKQNDSILNIISNLYNHTKLYRSESLFDTAVNTTAVTTNDVQSEKKLPTKQVNGLFHYSSYGYGFNRLIYGAPGTGKSYRADVIGNKYFNATTSVTFNPSYSYDDFVLSIKPQSDKNGHIKYDYMAGPFTNILLKALNNPHKQYLLIINEVNRGHVASIFKSIIQLLDRNLHGISVFSDKSDNILDHYLDSHTRETSNFTHYGFKIPSNLSLIATMNDHGLGTFALSHAFYRRWDLIYQPITFRDADKTLVAGFNIPWNIFGQNVNTLLIKKHLCLTHNTLIGGYSDRNQSLGSRASVASNLIYYLWSLTAYHHDVVFNSNLATFDDVYHIFCTSKHPLSIFNHSSKRILLNRDGANA